MNTAGPEVGTNRNVGVVSGALLGVINATESLVEEIVEAFVNIICLAHYNRVAFYG